MSNKQLRNMRDACEELHKNDAPYKKASDRDFLIYFLRLLIIALCIRTFIFEPVKVIGSSMYPNLIEGEGMFVEKITYTYTEPKHGDIIICHYPGFKMNGLPFNCVKRVIALPGDRISIQDGMVYLNGELLDESQYWNDYIFFDMEEVVIPERHVFVMGDNRNHSDDSRHPAVGPIPYGNIKGKVRGVIVPFADARRI